MKQWDKKSQLDLLGFKNLEGLGKLIILLAIALSTNACTEVLPRQRGNLALPQMALTTDALEFGLRQHTAFSKEAASGGYGGSGGGCGCN